jgi:flagellar protein FlbB
MENIGQEEREYNKFQWFLYVILIPFLFTVTLIVVILSVAGFKPLEKTKEIAGNIPLLETFIADEKQIMNQEERLKQEIVKLQKTVQEKEATLLEMERDLQEKQDKIEELQIEIEKLRAELQAKEEEQQLQNQRIKNIASLYETMSPKKAALVISSLDDSEAEKILTALPIDQVAAILEKMSPEDAAKYTKLLSQ